MRRTLLAFLCGVACGGDDAGNATADSGGSTAAATTSDGTTTTSPSGTTTTSDPQTGTTAADDGTASSSGGEAPVDFEVAGPLGVGIQTFEVQRDKRSLHVTLWYPAPTASAPTALASLYSGEDGEVLADLMAAGPDACVRSEASATLDAPIGEGAYPAVIFSHCLSCLGISSSFVAERLASHGIIVAGVTHTGDTLFEQQQGTTAPLSAEWLGVRAADVSRVLDELLSGPLAESVDAERLGVFGHSYGATTTGKVLQDDDRVLAGVALAAPVENPLLPGVSTADIAEPMLFLLAEEDNSIQAVGNNLIRNNASLMPGGSWLVEVADAGHWSVSDLCGIIDAFAPGCGEGTRQSSGEPFTYLNPETARNIAASYVTAFFALHLQDSDAGADYLDRVPADVVTVTRHDPG